MKRFLLFHLFLLIYAAAVFGQAPVIAYASPQTYNVNTPISSLIPSNTGGPVPANIYSQVSTFLQAGTGLNGPYGVATDAAGNIYVADAGNNLIRKITPGGALSTFAGSGGLLFSSPFGVAVDAQGNVYVADSGNNLIRKITSAGVVTTFAGGGAGLYTNGAALSASFNNPTGVAVDASNNVYVADYGNNVIRKISSGVVSTLAGSGSAGSTNAAGTAASFKGPFALTCDAAGNVYVADQNNNLIREITPSGSVSTLAGSGGQGSNDGTGTNASFNTPYGVVADTQGNIYVADANNDLIRMITPQGAVTTFAGTGLTGSADGIGTAAMFDFSTGITINSNGELFVPDFNKNSIRKIEITGYIMSAGSPALPAGLNFNAATGAISGTPTSVTAANTYTITAYNTKGSSTTTVSIQVIDPAADATLSALTVSTGMLSPAFSAGAASYVVNVPNSTTAIQLTPTATQSFSTLKINGSAINSGSQSAAITLSTGSNTITIKVTAKNGVNIQTYQVYVVRASPVVAAPNITYTSPNTYYLNTTIANLAPANSGGAVPANIYENVTTFVPNGKGLSAPYGLATDAAGNVYAADAGNNLIRKITPAGVVSTFAGAGGALFSSPYGIAVDAQGNVYVSDSGNNYIRKITPAGVVSIFAGNGNYDYVDGPALSSSFKNPSGIAVDASDNVYVADNGNNVIRKITPSGVVTTLAGNGSAGSANGTGTGATFDNPFAITCDASGNVYVTDQNDNFVRMITPSGLVTTLAGSGATGSDDGTGAAASFNNPNGLVADAQGDIYVADSNNDLVRKITPAGVVTTFAGSGIPGAANGVGAAASFGYTTGITINAAGELFISDNKTIRKIETTGYMISPDSPALPTGLNFAASTGTISGKPTAVTPAATYTISAYNTGGSSTASVSIQVIDPTADATLSALTVSTGTLSPTFTPATTTYYVSVPNSTTTIQFTPTAAATFSTITLNGSAITSGSLSAPVTLAAGSNTVTIKVTAKNGTTTQTYLVYAVRAAPVVAAPKIAYTTPQVYTAGVKITNLVPANTGGAVPAHTYGNVTTFAGASGAVFNNPIGLAADAQGNVYVADAGNGLIRKITPAGVVSIFSGNGAVTFHNPYGVAADAQGDIYISDSSDNLIYKATSSGAISTFAGSGNYDYADGQDVSASFRVPAGLATDVAGNVYVADYGNNAIRKITSSALVSTIAGSTIAGAKNGQGTAATFNGPFDVASDASGNIYVADRENNLVRKITGSGAVSTLAGNGAPDYAGGTGTAAGLNPFGLTLDALGNVYVADASNSLIREITPSGATSILAGSGTYGTLDGIGELAQFYYPVGITSDGQGDLFVSDNLSNEIRKVEITGYKISPQLPAGLKFDATTGTISGTPAASSALQVYTVTAYNLGGSSTFGISITINKSSDASLSALLLSSGTMAPVFAPGTKSYTASVSNTISNITVTPTTNNASATVTVNGQAVTSGSPSGNISLSVGLNTITVVITAQDGVTTNTYIIGVSRAQSSDATLSGLAVSNGALTPVFAPAATAYTVNVPYTVSTITATPTTNDPTATVKVNGMVVTSGSASGNIALTTGQNVITATITAQDGTIINYIVTVIRAQSSDATLSNLALSAGSLTPAFAASKLTYTATVTNNTGSITLSPTVSDPTATVKVNGIAVASGSASGNIALNVGPNNIATIVNAQDGTTETYTVTVTRAQSSDATLSNLTVSSGTLAPVFNPGTTGYALSVPNATSSIMLTPSANDPTATVKVNGIAVASGSASGDIALNVGPNIVTTIVSAQDGTTQTYTVTVTRAQSSDATLANLTIGGGTLTPVFNPGTTGYALSVPNATSNITLTPSTNDPTATVKVNGIAVASGSASGDIALNVGSNAVTTIVSAQDGTTQTYTVTVTRAQSSDATLTNLTISGGTLTPVFSSGTTDYSVSVPNATSSITLTPTANDPTATVKVDGFAVTSGSASGNIALDVGSNTISILVTAQDGTNNTYTITVTRAHSSDATLANLAVSSGTLTPAFSAGTNTYSVSVPSATSSMTVTPTANDPTATIKVNGAAVTSGSASANIALNIGSNTITTIVTAQDGTPNTYTLTVTRAQSSDATLANLAVSSGTLTPVFSPGTTGYAVSVPNATSSINLTPTANDPTESIKVDGFAVTSGTASADIALNVGSNAVTTIVSAQDGTKQTYTVTVTRAQSPDATLANLTISSGTLAPVFSPGTTGYVLSLPNATSSINLTPTVNDPTATIKVNGVAIASGSASGNIALNVGANTISILVTAQDGTTQTYLVTVKRAQSSDTTLSNLTASSGTLTPVFSPGTTGYAVSVPNATSSITLTPTANDPTATIKINGVAVTSSSATGDIALTVGSNTISVQVTAQDGTPNSYTVTVTRAQSSDATLANLVVSSGSLTPTFSPGTNSYFVNVPNATSGMTLTPSTNDPTATIKVDGVAVTSGSASGNIALNVGSNAISILVTAQDGTLNTYTIAVTRAQSSDAMLANLMVTNGTLAPTFSPGTNSYSVNVPNTTSGMTLTPSTNDPTATIKVNGVAVTSGSASGNIALSIGSNTITTIVTAQDGTTQTYTLTVTRAQSFVVTLSNLTISSGTLTPVFSPGTTDFAVSVPNATSSITLTPTANDPTATIKINGVAVTSSSASGNIALTVGSNTISILVTAQDGTTQNYTVTVTRAQSSDATLANLAVSSGTLTPVFSPGTNTYSASVSNNTNNLALTPTVNDPTATVKVNGVAVPSGSASGNVALNVGSNTISILVTAQDGTTQNYTVTVTRAQSSDATLANLAVSSGALTPVFSPGTNTYSAGVSNNTNSITLTPTANNPTATIKVNGVAVTSGSASGNIALNVGSNAISILVTAQDGTPNTYTITVTRAQSSDATLSNLTTSSGTLTPVFSPGKTGYDISVPNATINITLTPSTNDPTATIKVNGVVVVNGSASGNIALNVGPNTISILVTAQDGTAQTYTVTVTRAQSSDATLSNLTASSGTLTPVFSPGTTDYSVSVPNATSSITLTPTANDPTATVKVDGFAVTSGSASGNIALDVGSNTITAAVTAQDGTNAKTYKVAVTRAPSSNASLANLGLSTGTLSPAFAAGTTHYTVSVPNGTGNIQFTPGASDANSTVTINGATFASGAASGNIQLNTGSNNIAVIVTAQDGTTSTYTVVVTRAPSADAGLANISLSTGTLTPNFSAATMSYKVYVANSIGEITLTPVAADPNAKLTVNGTAVASGSASGPINLATGINTVSIIVTAQDGVTTNTYTVIVTRGLPANADLSNLIVNGETITPDFSPVAISYTLAVDNTVSSITVTPTTADVNATLKVNGTAVASGSASKPISLTVGSNVITTVVTAQDGITTKTYTVTVTRAPSGLSSDASLSQLTLNAGALSPAFTPGKTNYIETVPYSINSITVNTATGNANATVNVNGFPVSSGLPSPPVRLNIGNTLISVVVTAQDGTIQTYSVIVTREAPASNADLAYLDVSESVLNPGFANATMNYVVVVPNSTRSITLTPTAADTNATITVNGIPVKSGLASGPINLSVGDNVINVVVTAQNGLTTKAYTVTATRSAPELSSDATLGLLQLSDGVLSPAFTSTIETYTANVLSTTSSIRITPTGTNSNAKITVNGIAVANGSSSGLINLLVGVNTISIVVTAENGTNTLTYTITITREPFIVQVPNTFTPNGDGINDTWAIKNIFIYPDCTVKVFNRQGQLVFTSTGYGTPWDGSYRGTALPPGNYYYIIDLNHNKGVISGSVILLR